ncbi:hypothetical protein ACO2Q1_08850 [Brevundimonas sp. VNH65]|uniref:hypothetical protein n=1 Tax=Brevundimonas sp. VNH65 TaxID=3400917 RepID=UPI003BFEF961
MILSGASLIAADGLHDDGWCWPQTRLSLKALQPARELRIGVWFKPEEHGPRRVLFTVGPDGAAPTVDFVELDRRSELTVSMNLSEGDELGVRLSTPHRASRGDDARDLSFVLTSVTLL